MQCLVLMELVNLKCNAVSIICSSKHMEWKLRLTISVVINLVGLAFFVKIFQ